MSATIPATIRNVLGEERAPILKWDDGSWTCPYCGGASNVPDDRYFVYPCANPACEAHPQMDAETILKRRADRAALDARIAERQRMHEHAMASQKRWQDERAAELRAIVEAGYCAECHRSSGGRRKVRHRTADYHSR
jgi:hypothetical protein